jgi:cytochrome c-type biogenesis protein CcmF
MTLIHGVPTPMGSYTATYLGDSTEKKNDKVYFRIQFRKNDSVTGKVLEDFMITPNAFLMKGESGTQLSSNPGSRHYPDRDIFVYITSWLNPDNIPDTATFRTYPARQGDTVFYSNGFIVIEKMLAANKHDNRDLPVVDSAWLSELKVYAKDGREFPAAPAFLVKDDLPAQKTDTIVSQSLILGLMRGSGGKLELGVKESGTVMRYITLKAYKFPMINLLWLGTLIMVAGFLMSMWHRIRQRMRVA